MVVSRMGSSPPSDRTQPSSPEARSSATPESKIMCGKTVSVAIFRKWTEKGGETGLLGCPINQQTEAPPSPQGSTGRWIQFSKNDGGYLVEYTRPQALGSPKPPLFGQVFEVSGCMFKIYSSLGGTNHGRLSNNRWSSDNNWGGRTLKAAMVWDKQTSNARKPLAFWISLKDAATSTDSSRTREQLSNSPPRWLPGQSRQHVRKSWSAGSRPSYAGEISVPANRRSLPPRTVLPTMNIAFA